jgi:hypothetical protein
MPQIVQAWCPLDMKSGGPNRQSGCCGAEINFCSLCKSNHYLDHILENLLRLLVTTAVTMKQATFCIITSWSLIVSSTIKETAASIFTVAASSKMFITIYQTMLCHISEGSNLPSDYNDCNILSCNINYSCCQICSFAIVSHFLNVVYQ